jgi:hypothetical protein
VVLASLVKVDHDAHGVDAPEDVEKIEALMRPFHLKAKQRESIRIE